MQNHGLWCKNSQNEGSFEVFSPRVPANWDPICGKIIAKDRTGTYRCEQCCAKFATSALSQWAFVLQIGTLSPPSHVIHPWKNLMQKGAIPGRECAS